MFQFIPTSRSCSSAVEITAFTRLENCATLSTVSYRLMKTRVVGSLPGIHEWEKHMSVEAVSAFPVVASDAFLLNDNFGRTLTKKVGGLPEFRMRCRQIIDRLIVVIVGSITVTSGVSRCFYSFCPEILFEGDDSGVFALFADLCRLLKTCGLITAEESSRSVDEFGSYVIEKRGQHRSSEQSANSIVDVIEYLMQDFSFQSRIHLLRVFKLCCLAVRTLDVSYPSVSYGSSLVESAMQKCIKLIQSYVLSEGYSHQAFFTGQTMEAVRAAVDEAGVFFVCGEIILWKDFVGATYSSFVSAQRNLCLKLVLQRRKEYESHYIECNKINRLFRLDQSTKGAGSDTGSAKSGSSRTACGKSAERGTVAVVASKKDKSKGEAIVVKRKDGASTSKKCGSRKTLLIQILRYFLNLVNLPRDDL